MHQFILPFHLFLIFKFTSYAGGSMVQHVSYLQQLKQQQSISTVRVHAIVSMCNALLNRWSIVDIRLPDIMHRRDRPNMNLYSVRKLVFSVHPYKSYGVSVQVCRSVYIDFSIFFVVTVGVVFIFVDTCLRCFGRKLTYTQLYVYFILLRTKLIYSSFRK